MPAPTLQCAIDYPEISYDSACSAVRVLTWALPSVSLSAAFIHYLETELPGLPYTVHDLGDGTQAIKTQYDDDTVETMLFVIFLVGQLNARQLKLEAVLALEGTDGHA